MDVNQRAFSTAAIVESYARSEALDAAERRIFERFRDRIAGKAVLDLGCGAGRTTRALATLAASYAGVDLAKPMVERCRARFAAIDRAHFHVMDAASMPDFADSSFDFIQFSYNGIDYLAHEARQAALREVRRLLRPRGVFAFSTHNRRSAGLVRRPKAPHSLNPRRWATYARHLANSLSLRGREFACAEYEIVNEQADGFRLLGYHATAAVTAAQLAAAGLRLLDVLDTEGKSIAPEGDHPDVAFFYFVATPA